MHRTLLPVFCAALALALSSSLASAAPAAASSLVNGSFEPTSGGFAVPRDTHAIPGWRVSARGVAWLVAATEDCAAPNGEWIVRLEEDGAPGTLTQVLATMPGERYDVVFWLGSRARGGTNGRATLRVETGGETRDVAIDNAAAELLWQAHVITFTARAAATTLSLRAGAGAPAYVDAVAVRPAASAEARAAGEEN